MRFPWTQRWLWRGGLSGVVLLFAGVMPASAQWHPSPWVSVPTCNPAATAAPCAATEPAPVPPPDTAGPPDTTAESRPAGTEAVTPLEGFGPPRGPGETISVQDSNAGYVDSAIIGNVFRLRYDSAYRDIRPDRAEFIYPKMGRGPRLEESRIDVQDISGYAEVAFGKQWSAFVEVPFRFLNPEQNANAAGFSDINLGARYAVIANHDRYLTAQFRAFVPTGIASHGLGTGHVSLEPAVLLFQRLGGTLVLEAELRDWIPIGGSDFAGNVIRYGAALSYTLDRHKKIHIAPVMELVGWTVLGGKESTFPTGVAADAAGDTIINADVGVRVGFGECSSLYVGYGRALTRDVWYKDIIRVEYRLSF
jgi:hypothetical protein